MSRKNLKGIKFHKSSYKNEENKCISVEDEGGTGVVSEKSIFEKVEEFLTKFDLSEGKSSTQVLGLFSIVSAIGEHKDYHQINQTDIWKVMDCIALSISHTSRIVRTSALRLARNLVKSEKQAKAAIESFLPIFLTRYVDLSVSNSGERGHALRLIRRILHLNPVDFPVNVSAALAALAAEGSCFTEGKNQRKDQLWRVTLSILQEMAVLSPEVYIACGGVRASLMAVSEINEPRTLEAVLVSILNLYDLPLLRHRMHFNVQQLCAPYTEFFYSPPLIQPDKEKSPVPEWRDRSRPSSLQAILTTLRSWTGFLGFCSSSNDASGGHFRSLVEALKVPNLDTRKKILDLLDQLFRLDTTCWTDEVAVAFKARNKARSSWKLQNGFVAEEGKDILPSLSRCRPDLVKNHTALLIYSLVQAELPDALIQVIQTSDSVVSVRATVLLGEFFYLTYHYLPPGCYSTSICLSNLMDNLSETSESHLAHLHRAIQTSEALGQYQSTKFQPLKSASAYLRQLIFFSTAKTDSKTKPYWRLKGRNTARLKGVIKFSRVCLHEDHLAWDWTLVCAALTWPSESFRHLEDSYYKMFVRNLVNFFKPSKNQFCSYEYGIEKTRSATIAGCLLVDFLLSCSEGESDRFALELIDDIRLQLQKVLSAESAHDCLFSPAKMTSSACRDYFLLVGRFSQTERGLKLLSSSAIFQDMLQLVITSPHDCYVKLVLSTQNYNCEGFSRAIFNRVISSGQEQTRHFATLLLCTLLRICRHCSLDGRGIRSTLPSWAIGRLIGQMDDASFRIRKIVNDIIDEICDDSEYLTTVMEFHPILSADEKKYSALMVRFLSNPNGYRYLLQSGFLRTEMERWNSSENQSYITKLELALCDCLSQHQKDESGAYGRVSDAAHVVRDFPVPHHIYGELGQHPDGVDFLKKNGSLQLLTEALDLTVEEDGEALQTVKAALWALGHLAGASGEGLKLVQTFGDNLGKMCRIAGSSPILSLRGTAFYALNLVARTADGADTLKKYGWIAVRHDHLERWPIVSEDDWDLQPVIEYDYNDSGISASNRDRTTSQGSDKSVSFADEVDYIESLEVHEEESSDIVRWDLESTDTSISKDDSIERRKVRFFPVRKKASTLPRTTPSTPVSHRRSQSLSEPQKPVRIFRAIRDSFRMKRLSFSAKTDSFSDVSTPEGSTSSSFGLSSLRETFRRFSRSRTSETLAISPRKSQSPQTESFSDPSSATLIVSSAPTSTPLAERLKKKRSAFFANLEVVEPLSVSMPVSSAIVDSEKRLVSSDSESEPDSDGEVRKETRFAKFMASSPVSEVVSARKGSDFAKKDNKHEHLSRVGSTLSQLRTVQYKMRNVVIERSSSLYFMGLCLPAQPHLMFPTDEFLNPRQTVPLMEAEKDVSCLPLEVVDEHQKETCFRCAWKVLSGSEGEENEGITCEERETVRKELLNLVAKIGTGIGMNAHEEGLLRLKQAFPSLFRDGCLYSDVCHYISTRTYHLRSRRFLQELFIDFSFH